MNPRVSKRVPEEKAATPADIRAAIEGLTEADAQRLLRFADRRIWRIGRAAGRRDAEDLLQEAVADLLGDTRRWDKTRVGFLTFLFGAMRSISSNWAKAYKSMGEVVLATDLQRLGACQAV